jgi:hypothetical protein
VNNNQRGAQKAVVGGIERLAIARLNTQEVTKMRMMRVSKNTFFYGKRKPETEKIEAIDQRTGKTKVVKRRVHLPKGCSVPHQICILCLKNRIHRNDPRYESKICKSCD